MQRKVFSGSSFRRKLVVPVAMDSFEMKPSIFPELPKGPSPGRALAG
jgi:hypothetical protein